MRRRPFLFIGLASFLSAVLCTAVPLTVAVVTVAAVAVLAVIAAKLCARSLWLVGIVGTVALTVSVLFAVRDVCTVQPQTALHGTTATVTMRVEEALPSTSAYLVRVESGTVEKGTRLCFWPTYHHLSPNNGDLLTAEVELLSAYDPDEEFGFTARANGVYLYAWPTKDSTLQWEDGTKTLSLPRKALYALRDGIHTALYRHMPYDAAAMAEGIMLGRRGNLSVSVANAFRASGVYHLLAVSGTHLAILTSAMVFILQKVRCSRRLTALLTMVFVLLFMALCGFTASVTRAGVMTLIVLSGRLFRRRSDGLNTLGFAVAVMLLCDPFCAYDIGWQLSFAATLGLLLFEPVWEREITRRLSRVAPRIRAVLTPLSTAVGVTLSATMATAPLTAWHFGGISAVFLFSNLLCVPLASILLLLMFAAVLTVWLAPLSDMLFFVGGHLSRFLTAYTTRLASLSVAQVTADGFVTVWLLALLVALVYGYCRRRMRGVWRATAVMTAVLLVGSGTIAALTRNDTVIATASGNNIVMTVRSDGTNGLIAAPDANAPKEAAMLLSDEGIRSLDWMVWLGTADQPFPDFSMLSVPVDRLLVMSPPEEYRVLPSARTVNRLHDGGTLTAGDAVCVERCDEFVRVCIGGKTVCLLTTDRSADAARLPQDWCKPVWLCTGSDFENRACIDAQTTLVFCGHSKVRSLKGVFPEALIAVENDTQHLRLQTDGEYDTMSYIH